jgi:short subunit fatty acids transporter
MDKLLLIQTILFLLQVLIIPFIGYILKEKKEEIIEICSKLILEHYTGLSDLIQHNRRLIDNLEDSMKHKREIAKIKNEIVIARIKDIELYLGRKNGFQARDVHNVVEIEGDDVSGIY